MSNIKVRVGQQNAIRVTSSISGGTAFADNSTNSTNVIGGIASVTQLSVSGVSTLGFATASQIYTTGIVTAISGFVGNLTGTASTASFATTSYNLTNAANITTGTIDSARLSGTYNINISGSSSYATTAGIATYATTAGIATYATTAGIATYATTAGIATYATTAGIATYATTAGIATYATTAGIATSLQNSRTFEITGDILASPISFNGTGNVSLAATIQPNSVALGTDTVGDYVQSITGTTSQIVVTGGTGESSTPVLSFSPNPTLGGNVTIGNDLQVNRNLNVTGNITVGGTTAYIIVQDFRVTDSDIVLGFTTNVSGNDASTDTTANHGGISVASTEGSPLVQLVNVAIGESLPATYKKFMWFKSGSFAGLNTDAWLSNYAIGIGSTQFPSGTRLAAGSVQFTERDLAVVRNINASGIITATTFSGNATNSTYATSAGIATYAGTSGIATYATSSGIATYATSAGIATYATSSGIATYSGTAGIATYATSAGIATYSGTAGIATYATSAGIATYATSAGIATYATSAGIATYATSAGIATYATSAGIATYATSSGIATYSGTAGISTSVIGGISSVTQLQVTGISTFTNGPIFVGSGTSTGTALQRLQVTGGAYVSGSVGVGTTNPTEALSVFGKVQIQQDVNSNNRLIFRGTDGSSYRWNIDNYQSSNTFRIFREDDVTSANGFVALSISTTGTVSATKFSGDGSLLTNVPSSGIVTYANNAGSATYATSSGISTYAGTAGIATYASTSGVSTSVIGGIASVTSLNVSGISTLGTVRVSTGIITATSGVVTYYGDGSKLTGVTAFYIENQTFTSSPVYPTFASNTGVSTVGIATTGLIFIPSSGNLGVGTTNPTSKLYVVGDAYITGILTANRIISTVYGEFLGGSISGTNIVGTSLSITGISTLGTVQVSSGIVTATSGIVTYYGDGSNLTGIIASGSGIDIRDDGIQVGTATTIDFSSNLSVSSLSSGIATVTATNNFGLIIAATYNMLMP